MEISARLSELAVLQPRLQWDDIIPAAAAVLTKDSRASVVEFHVETVKMPLFAGSGLQLQIELDVPPPVIERIGRTFERSRLIELAAIAVAGLAIYHAGGHEMRDVAFRGSSADYLVDDSQTLLEIAGRSRKSDLNAAWQLRQQRLHETAPEFYYLCVCEFETMSARLGFYKT